MMPAFLKNHFLAIAIKRIYDNVLKKEEEMSIEN